MNALSCQFPGAAALAVVAALVCGCSSAPLRDDNRLVTANAMALPFDGSSLPDASTNLPTLDAGPAPTVVIPDSGFIDKKLDDVQTLPFQPLGRTTGTDIVIGRASDDRYRAGIGWVDDNDGNDLKLSLFRQQTVGDEFDGLWLASLQGELTPRLLRDDFDLTGELAVATNDSSSHGNAGGSGIRLHLARKPKNGFGYGLSLSQFSDGFHPYGSIVDAGERRAAVDLSYRFWPGTQMTADADYILRNWNGDLPCDEYRTDLSLLSTVFNDLRAKLETSTQRTLDCGDTSDIDSWALTLSEHAWTGWDISLVAKVSEESPPFMDEQRTRRHYHVSGDHDLRLGPLLASFGPEVSLQTVTNGTVQRRLQTGVVMGIETRAQAITLHMGYESLTGSSGTIDDTDGRIKLNYRLDFDA
ncbi:MAG: hypothetical protein HWE39_14935 [Oceanospirillaceae bacterium]|nr:hypothetical protein [Oceanospirillaceae bacterium]